MTTATASTLARAVEGSRGTICWINGYGKTRVEVLEVGEDYLLVQKWDEPDVLAVPLTAILYFKFAGEDD